MEIIKMDPRIWRRILLVLSLCASSICAAKPSTSPTGGRKLEKFDSYTNDTRASAGTTHHLDRIFTPKVSPHAGPLPRNGIGIEKGPPDLQFGLAFTVPFVSLSTERLLNQVSQHRGYDSLWDLANVLKLNVGGLVVAAVVGVAALLFLPAIFPRFGNIFNGGGFGTGGGGWPSNGFGGFFPGFLEQLVPGFGLTKPIGYGQTYDQNTYPYNNQNDPYYGSYSQRNEKDAKSRALKDDPTAQNGTTGNFWSDVIREVRNTATEFETCALYAMCQQGRNVTQDATNNQTLTSRGRGRGGRKEGKDGDPSDPGDAPLSSFEHIVEAVNGIGGDLPAVAHIHQAFEAGKKGQDCSKYYKKCPLSKVPIAQIVQNMGEYVFN